MSESTNMDNTITDEVNMSTSLTADDSSIAGDSTIDEAGTGSFTVPMIESEEDELLNTTEPDDLTLADPKAPTEYYLIQLSSQCRATKLTDSARYSYTKKMTRGNTTYWTCAVRNEQHTTEHLLLKRTMTSSMAEMATIIPVNLEQLHIIASRQGLKQVPQLICVHQQLKWPAT